MPGPLLRFVWRDDEVMAVLQGVPRKVQQAVKDKMESILSQAREDIFETVQGKYIDPKTIISGVMESGSSITGFLESNDKGGLYTILPHKGKFLVFIGARDGQKVAAQIVRHPYPKGTPLVIRKMAELKPWIEDQLEDVLIDAL